MTKVPIETLSDNGCFFLYTYQGQDEKSFLSIIVSHDVSDEIFCPPTEHNIDGVPKCSYELVG
jgi:hypothetical protein